MKKKKTPSATQKKEQKKIRVERFGMNLKSFDELLVPEKSKG